jgi:hypothetical protein
LIRKAFQRQGWGSTSGFFAAERPVVIPAAPSSTGPQVHVFTNDVSQDVEEVDAPLVNKSKILSRDHHRHDRHCDGLRTHTQRA